MARILKKIKIEHLIDKNTCTNLSLFSSLKIMQNLLQSNMENSCQSPKCFLDTLKETEQYVKNNSMNDENLDCKIIDEPDEFFNNFSDSAVSSQCSFLWNFWSTEGLTRDSQDFIEAISPIKITDFSVSTKNIGYHFREKVAEIERLDIKTSFSPGLAFKKFINQSHPKKKQSQWKNIPGHIMSGIKNGALNFFEKSKGIKISCISKILNDKSKEVQEKIHNLIMRYDSRQKTWRSIMRFLNQDKDDQINKIFIELIHEFLSPSNDKDFEEWLSETRMTSKTTQTIRNSKKVYLEEFIERIAHSRETDD